MLNFQSHWRPAGRNFGPPPKYWGSLFSSFGVLRIFGVLGVFKVLGLFVFKTSVQL